MPQQLLEAFAAACEKAVAPNGDLQEDGWGVAWLDKDNNWNTKKSLNPIWEDTDIFSAIPQTKMLAIHARSATFPKEKGNISYNQPYIAGKYCFVFNGAIRGVTLNRPVPGDIGAQKIWSLLQENLQKNTAAKSLENVKNYLEEHSEEIVALNIGVAANDTIAALCKFSKHKNYYTLKYESNSLRIISSVQIRGYSFNNILNNEIITF